MTADLAIIVPVFDEEKNIGPLAEEVLAALRGEKRTFEIVFVDDGSTDNTWTAICEARRRDRRVRGLRHLRNAGQSAALWTGLQNTTARLLASLDGDRQNDPADLPRLLDELKRADFVCGVRVKRHDNWLRRVSSRVARVARRTVLGVDFQDTGCGLRVFRRDAVAAVFPFNGWHRFLPVLVQGTGARTLEVPVNHRPRVAGRSKYGVLNRLGRGVLDLLGLAWYQRRRLVPVPIALPED